MSEFMFGNEFLFGQADDGTVLLTTAASGAELMLLEGLLTDNGIVYVKRDRGAGGYMRVLGGFSIYGTDVRVFEADYERAKELIDAYASGAAIEPEPGPEQE